jgi:pathogenesis-related protein 1
MKRWGPLAVVLCLGLVACGGDDDPLAGDAAPPGDGAHADAGTIDGQILPPVDAPGAVGEPPELAGITMLHNQVRQQVDTATPLPPLEWDESLAATAAAWVAQCRDTEAPAGLIDHNPNRSQGHPYYVGENVYGSSGQATAQGAVQTWAAEKANYNYANNTCNGVCGHYTQIVWRTTQKLGCAIGDCPNLTYRSSIVCNYGPGGNINGQRPY